VGAGRGRDAHEDDLGVDTVGVAVVGGHAACRGNRRGGVAGQVPGACDRGRVGRVLLGPLLEQDHAGIEGQRREQQQRQQADREDDEDLAALGPISC
jgi:hypothetical protein